MHTRPLGPGAPAVSIIGFGGMPLSIRDRPDERVGIDVIHAALDHGVTFIDTANVYCLDDDDIGHNERLVAKALRQRRGSRDDIIVGTKGGMVRPGGQWERDGRPEQLRQSCEASLKALKVDRIDLYQLHAPDPMVEFEDSVGALADLQREGKIRWIGLSNVSIAQIEEARRLVDVTTVQNRLNPFFREALEEGVVSYCAEQGIGFLAYSPVGGGRLNNTLPEHPILRPIAEARGATPHEVVLSWVLAQGESVIAIPGARTVEHAVSSTRAAEHNLNTDELAAVTGAEFSRA